MKVHLLVGVLLISLAPVKAQIKSSHDGFYTSDSVLYQLSGKDSFKYCVNCYSADSLHTYNGGVWLYSREHLPNNWENSDFSKGNESFDGYYKEVVSNLRADVVKANTIWVRIYSDTGYTDQHHLVFLGNWRPKATTLISLLIDSSDFMGAQGFYGPGKGLKTVLGNVWNYRQIMEKNCSYQIFGGEHLQLEASQACGVEIGALASANYPDKAIQINANRTSNTNKLLFLGKSLTDSLGNGIKILRFRIGGTNHQSNILANEIAASILRPENGGEPSTAICLFVNGSFWTYAFAGEIMEPNHISKVLKSKPGELTWGKTTFVAAISDVRKMGLTLMPLNNSIYSVCGFLNICPTFYSFDDTLQFLVNKAGIEHNALLFNELCNTIRKSDDSDLCKMIQREDIYRYALSIWFFRNADDNHLTVVNTGEKPWKLFAEHYDFIAFDSMNHNNPDENFFTDKYARGQSKNSVIWQATKRMLSFDREYFCLVIEDELNTTYKPERTVNIAKQKIASLRPCITECSRAWWPNGWLDSVNWEKSISGILPFLSQRPGSIAAMLPGIFMTGPDSLLTPKDMNEVRIFFDGIADKNAVVKLNSLEVKSDFSGRYYPRPFLRIALQWDTTRYQFVKWLEFPDSLASFRLSACKPIALTPILRLRGAASSKYMLDYTRLILKRFFTGECAFYSYCLVIILIIVLIILIRVAVIRITV